MRRTLATRLAALLLLVAPAIRADEATLKAGVFDPPRAAPDFTLRGSDGSDLTLSRYRGKVVVLFFGYTHCPTVCPTTLATLAGAHKRLGTDAGAVRSST
jgi:protein SCO1/2